MNNRIRELALESGLLNYVDNETPRRYFVHADIEMEDIEKFAELVAAAEREECARVANMVAREIDDTNGTATYISKAIRARSGA